MNISFYAVDEKSFVVQFTGEGVMLTSDVLTRLAIVGFRPATKDELTEMVQQHTEILNEDFLIALGTIVEVPLPDGGGERIVSSWVMSNPNRLQHAWLEYENKWPVGGGVAFAALRKD